MHNLNSLLLDLANENEKGITFISSEEDIFVSYQDILKASLKVLGSLQQAGLKAGNEVMFQIDDNNSFITLFWGCILGGILPVPLNVNNNSEHFVNITKVFNILNHPFIVANKKAYDENITQFEKMNVTKERILLFEDIRNGSIDGELYDPCMEDTAFIQFSSGSTGDPKGVILTHYNLISDICSWNRRVKTTESDVSLSWLPLTHDFGLILGHLANVQYANSQYFIPTQQFISQPDLWIKKVSQYKASLLYSPNFGLLHAIKYLKAESADNIDWSSVRFIANGAEPISDNVCNDFLTYLGKYGMKRTAISPGYGLAEGTVACCISEVEEDMILHHLHKDHLSMGQTIELVEEADKAGLVYVALGRQLDCCEIRICDDDDHVFDENILGNVQLHGSTITKGYINNESATRALFTEDGWLRTGDLGFLRDSRLVITGRSKEIIFINGHNYYPQDIEKIAGEIEGIELGDMVACGIFNKQIQKDDIVIFVLFNRDIVDFVPISLDIKRKINKLIGLVVKDVVPVKEIPKTESGKVKKYVLADMYKNNEFNETIGLLQQISEIHKQQNRNEDNENEVQNTIKKIWMDILELDHVNINDNFFACGGNSVKLISLMAVIEKVYPNRIVMTDTFSHPTIASLSELIEDSLVDSNTISRTQYLELPEEYFQVNCKKDNLDKGVEDLALKFVIKEDLYDKLASIAQRENANVTMILLGTYVLLLSQIANRKEIPVATIMNVHDKGRILNFDLNGIGDFTDLISYVKKRFDNMDDNKYFSMNEMKNMQLLINSAGVLPLVYRKDLSNANVDMIDYFSPILTIDSTDNALRCEFNYQNMKLNKEKMDELFQKYINLTVYIVDKYEA